MEELRDRILDLLENLHLRDQIQVLANVFISIGANYLPLVEDTHESLFLTIAEQKRKHGETLGTALAEQGLYLLTWLNGDK